MSSTWKVFFISLLPVKRMLLNSLSAVLFFCSTLILPAIANAVDFGISASERSVTTGQNSSSSGFQQLIIHRKDFDGPIDIDVEVSPSGAGVDANVNHLSKGAAAALKGGNERRSLVDVTTITEKFAENGVYQVTVTATGIVNGEKRTRVATFDVIVKRNDTFSIAVKPPSVTLPQGSVTTTNVEIGEFGNFNDSVYLEISSERGKTLDGFDFDFSGENAGHKGAANRSDLFTGSHHWITEPDSNNKSVSQLTIITYPDTVPGDYVFYVHGKRDAKKTVDRQVGRGRGNTAPTQVDSISTRRAMLRVTVTADPLFIELIEPVEFEIYPAQATLITPPSDTAYIDQVIVSATRSLKTITLRVALEPDAKGIRVAMDHRRVNPQRWTNNLLVSVSDEAKPGTYIATITGRSRGSNNKKLIRKTQVKIVVPEKVDEETTSVSIGKDAHPVEVNCTGAGCPAEPIIGTCIGNSCSETFDLNCSGTGCAEEIIISCSGDTCSNEGIVDCGAGECDDVGGFSCGDSVCDAVPTHSVLDDLAYDKTDVSNLTLNTNLFPRQNTTLVPRIQTCELCQSIADQVYELDVRLNDLVNDMSLWSDVEDQPAEQEKLHKEEQDKKVEREKLAAKLELCQKKCPEPEDFYPPEPIDINCVGQGCIEDISGTCIGNSCGESFDLYCPGTGCAEDILVSCSGDSCSDEGTVDCGAGECDDVGGFSCSGSGCDAVPPRSIFDDLGYDTKNISDEDFHSVLKDIGGLGQTGLISIRKDDDVRRGGNLVTNCKKCEQLALSYNREKKGLYDLFSQRGELEKEESRIKYGIETDLISIQAYRQSGSTASDIVGHAAGLISKRMLDGISEMSVSLREAEVDGHLESLVELGEELATLKSNFQKIDKEIAETEKFINDIYKALIECEKKCIIVELINVISITGNPPFDPRDPISEESDDSVEKVTVINNIPVSRLTLTGTGEAGCPPRHYHGGANNCSGVFTADPAPANCGHGVFGTETSIAVTSCPDL